MRMGLEDRRNYARELLERRYNKCDSEGHQMPNQETGMCNYCDRHLIQSVHEKHNDRIRGLARIIHELEEPKQKNNSP